MTAEEGLGRSQRGIRADLEELVLRDLCGPAGGDDEELMQGDRAWDGRVSERYLLGMLAPKRQSPEDSTVEDDLALTGSDKTDEGGAEPTPPAVEQLFPSSFGMTFAVAPETEEISAAVGWGSYSRMPSETLETEAGNPKTVWKRQPAGSEVPLRLDPGPIGPLSPDPDYPGVQIHGRVRDRGGQRLVTLFLVNGQTEPEERKDEAWLFQAELRVWGTDGSPPFVQRTPPDTSIPEIDAAEHRSQQMLYRHQVEFAGGHGVGVHAEPAEGDPTRATEIRTAAVPSYDVPQTQAPTGDDHEELKGVVLDMRILAEAEDAALPAMLTPLVGAYEAWIEREAERIDDPSVRLAGFGEQAEAALQRCRDAAGRMRTGIEALANRDVAEAFRFANDAMWRQRVHTLAAELRRAKEISIEDALEAMMSPENHCWRPFQLAFVLINLPGIAGLDHQERSSEDGAMVDLLWFPTGGGKTEAYLGLTAFTLATRRLQGEVEGHDGSEGVGVLMRYTLRLLTLQQFQRATALVCAMEVIRAERIAAGDRRWGETPFRIGLWVGQRSTPNRFDDAEEWVENHKGGKGHLAGGSNSPAQLARCPWCGSEIEPGKHIHPDPVRRRTITYCGDKLGRCEFSRKQRKDEGLPAVVVDEEVYRLLPGLLIGTVDKFAQMPWNGATQTLFGRVAGRCERHGFRWPMHPDDKTPSWEASRHPAKGGQPPATTVDAGPLRPPDLIIQDELHLISGPLGSLVGLYETAVDRLCSWEVNGVRVRPKVIASTATIRRADYQVKQLFDRQVKLFPPSGLDARDSFFALQRDRPGDEEKHPGRRYLGICAPGRRLKNVLIRVYVAQMAAAEHLIERGEVDADTYMTLVGYFNSLRELGGMRRLVDDDVATRLGKMDERGLSRRPRPLVEELTSRRSAEEIPKILDQLSVRHAYPRPKEREEWPLDVVLATNMISVGVDVPRLGTMVVAGQPKSTSEYIQATSRIGRQTPGLVFTVFNWARPRDLSHYESFEHYHATFYGQVEALSVTPFAPRAIDRGLTGILASLLRLEELDWNPNLGAEAVDRSAERTKAASAAIADRAASLTSSTEVGEAVAGMLQDRLDRWAREQQVAGRRLGYRTKGGSAVGLLHDPGDGRWDVWTAPNSLREVEPGIRLILRPRAASGELPDWEGGDEDGEGGAED